LSLKPDVTITQAQCMVFEMASTGSVEYI